MKVIIDRNVEKKLNLFYASARIQHPTLDAITVRKKMRRLKQEILSLSYFPERHPLARYKQEWIEKEFRDLAFENFHFAYKVVQIPSGELAVYVADVCYDMGYHE